MRPSSTRFFSSKKMFIYTIVNLTISSFYLSFCFASGFRIPEFQFNFTNFVFHDFYLTSKTINATKKSSKTPLWLQMTLVLQYFSTLAGSVRTLKSFKHGPGHLVKNQLLLPSWAAAYAILLITLRRSVPTSVRPEKKSKNVNIWFSVSSKKA